MNPHQYIETFTKLQIHHTKISQLHMRQLFERDANRFAIFSLQAPHIFLDYAKNRIVPDTLQLLLKFAENINLSEHIEALFSGKHVNVTEHKPALHTALRDPNDAPLYIDGINIKDNIRDALGMMRYFVSELHKGLWKGYNGEAVKDVIHLGIGGSHLGPMMGVQALGHVFHSKWQGKCHFVSGLDATELDELLKDLNPNTTLFIIASKTFTTQETLINAQRARKWISDAASGKDITNHFVGITAQIENAVSWGIPKSHIFPLWDWVGGRYSLWSSMGLPIAIMIGMDQFQALLAGATDMDEHFRHTAFAENMPVILALLSFWYIVFFKSSAHAVLPYDHRLRALPHYLQQLSMESNGKSVQCNGTSVNMPTAPVLFGGKGTEGQHSFYQLLLQGTHLIPCDFIATLRHHGPETKQPLLLSHCLAQSRALMLGKTKQEVIASLLKQGYTEKNAKKCAPHRVIIGNQPSNTLIISTLTPQTLGALIALYEHKTFVEGILWSINSFDQYGVELGKELAEDIKQRLIENDETLKFDASTEGLLAYCKQHSY
ncbi:MAG: pgi [Gammaproteobacteria bacterium]|jgi:glucose-6-phosphate isomerase|nr:pgi [Gammaproteobacteria bacterium]